MTMLPDQKQPASIGAFTAPLGIFGPAVEYMVDAAQRSVLFWDVMRQRSNQYEEHLAKVAPHVLRSEEHTSELQSQSNLVCRLLLEKKKIANHLRSPL